MFKPFYSAFLGTKATGLILPLKAGEKVDMMPWLELNEAYASWRGVGGSLLEECVKMRAEVC